MKSFRLNRLFNPVSKKCFDVAVDHGFFNEYQFLEGIENIRSAIEMVVQASPDAIQLTAGQAKYLQQIPGKQKPALVLRTDVANVYGASLTTGSFSKMIEQAALQAVRLDAACMCINLFSIPGAPEVTGQCIDNIIRLKLESEHYQVPLMIEPLVFRPNSDKGGYMVDGDIKKIISLVRQAVELGADIIKADPCTNVEAYHQVIEVAGDIPVLVRGGGKTADEEIIKRTAMLMQQGASGIVYGRNIIQHKHPAHITRLLMDIVHGEATLEDTLAKIQ
ncbi:class I fructose-bisphosphate aldolase [Agriterribacter humi]|jgi:DhnA family fructose-bisphosphate aldolase class Ia|uniref:class I fructose-bisphosphate aldolase n=1 Tax=Agriterribacter humi TaxID=1104781 RepID=UPI0012654F57|nr:aldolase [Agriterribacter humi]